MAATTSRSMSALDCADASSTSHTPPASSGARALPAASANRVLPTPPGPVRVTSLDSLTARQTCSIESVRPTIGDRSAGRLPSGARARSDGERDFHVGGNDLPHLLGLGEVTQAHPAEVEERRALGRSLREQHTGGARHEHLAAVRRAHQAGAPAQREPEPVVTSAVSGPGMDGHAHAQRGTVTPVSSAERALRVDGCEHAVRHRRERRAQPVARVLELDALVLGERGPQNRVVPFE